MFSGIDVSAYQPNIKWQAVPAATAQFVFAKATQSTNYSSDQFQQQHDGANSRGFPFGAYHYLDATADGTDQAHYFLNAINGYEGQLLPALDAEEANGQTPDQVIKCMSDFTAAVEATLGGKRMIIYTGWNFWQNTMGGRDDFAGHPLWLAQYPDNYAPGMNPDVPNGWRNATIWQYSSKGNVAGITGGIDMDLLLSDDLGVISR